MIDYQEKVSAILLEQFSANYLPGACWQLVGHHRLFLLTNGILVVNCALAYEVYDVSSHPWPMQHVTFLGIILLLL